jgi:hypothetical protein
MKTTFSLVSASFIPPTFFKWRRVAATLVLSGFLAAMNAHGSLVAGWNLTGLNNVATATATTFDPNLDSANTITRGLGAAASAGINSFRTVGFQNNGISTANTDYFQTTLSAASGYTFSLSSIDARFAGTASFRAAPGVSAQFAYSLDGTTFTLIGSPFNLTADTAMPQIDLTGIGALQNVADTTTVSFRYYASGQTPTGGWGLNSPSNLQDGLDFNGTISVVPVPEPSTFVAGVLLALPFGVQGVRLLRNREQA